MQGRVCKVENVCARLCVCLCVGVCTCASARHTVVQAKCQIFCEEGCHDSLPQNWDRTLCPLCQYVNRIHKNQDCPFFGTYGNPICGTVADLLPGKGHSGSDIRYTLPTMNLKVIWKAATSVHVYIALRCLYSLFHF